MYLSDHDLAILQRWAAEAIKNPLRFGVHDHALLARIRIERQFSTHE